MKRCNFCGIAYEGLICPKCPRCSVCGMAHCACPDGGDLFDKVKK